MANEREHSDKSREEQFTAWLKENEYAPYSSRRDDLWRAWNAGAMFVKSSTSRRSDDAYIIALARRCGWHEVHSRPLECFIEDAVKAFEQKSIAPSATLFAPTGWIMWSTGDGAAQELCPTEADVQRFITDSIFGVHTSDDVNHAEIQHHMKTFRNPNAWSGNLWDVRFEDGGIHALKLELRERDDIQGQD